MNKNGFLFVPLSLSLLFSCLMILNGCGAKVTEGTESVTSTNPNNGTIAGYVYKVNQTTRAFVGIPGATVSVSEESMTLEATVTTDAAGKYTLSGLPSGKIAVTATNDSSAPVTIVANSATFNFVISREGANPAGTATIRGILYGFPNTASSINVNVYPLSGNSFASPVKVIDLTYNTFEVTGAPDDGVIYVRIRYNDGIDLYYAYDRFTASPGGTYDRIITYEAGSTVEATFTLASGYSNFNNAQLYLSRNNMTFTALSSVANPSSFEAPPPLAAGESYTLQSTSYNTDNETFIKWFWGIQPGHTTLTFLPSAPPNPFVTFPPNGVTYTGVPTFEWGDCGATYYGVSVYDSGNNLMWKGVTYDTKIKIPGSIAATFPSSATYSFEAFGVNINNYNTPINLMNVTINNPQYNYVIEGTGSFNN